VQGLASFGPNYGPECCCPIVTPGAYGQEGARRPETRRASFDGRPVTYGFGELDTLVPAYAAKSQGSEYPAVVIR
jgi:ATP-dependent exoDNAse (exonuclease V) alpha subunit